MTLVRILCGDALEQLATLPDASHRCAVTSPPYFGLRDYGTAGQMGIEATPEAYVAGMVAVFREVRRVLTDDGTLWLVIGDSYFGSGKGGNPAGSPHLKNKDLIGIPWMLALALRADGWYLRSDIIWHKPNPMPESVTDRPTKSHEYMFLLSKSQRYHYNADAIAEDAIHAGRTVRASGPDAQNNQKGEYGRTASGFTNHDTLVNPTRNARTVWTIPTQPYKGAHFATFPEELARRCIVAGSAPADSVLDPFGGSGTVGAVALAYGRSATLIEINQEYVALARERIGPAFAIVNAHSEAVA